MLQLIRDYAKGTVAWVLMIMISVPFALWGIQSYFGTGQENPIAVVGDKEIFQRDVNRIYEMNLASNEAIAQQEQLFKMQALDGLIGEEVMKQSADQLGLLIADDSVRRFIRELPYFQEDGVFNQEKYKQALASQGMSSELFIQQVRSAMRSDQFQMGVRQTSFIIDKEIDHYFSLAKEKRSVDYFKLSTPTTEIVVSDEEVENYFKEHQDQFMTDVMLSIDYVVLDLKMLARDESVSDDQLKKFYDENLTRFTQAERRRVSHILLEIPESSNSNEVKEEARKLRNDLVSGNKDFAETAKQLSKDPGSAANGGDLGVINKGDMVPAFENAAYSLKAGEISEPIETDFGIHLITITELTPEEIKPFSAVKDELLQEIQRQQAESRFFELAEQLAEVAYETPDSLQPAADLLNTEIQQSELFSSSSGAGIAENVAVRNAAFSPDVAAGNNSEPVEVGADQVIVMRQKERKDSEPKALDDVSENIRAKLVEEKRQASLKAKVDELEKELSNGKQITALAEQEKLEVTSQKELTRDQNDLPFELKKVVFTGQILTDKPLTFATRISDGSYAIGVVNDIIPGDISAVAKDERKSVEKQILAAKGRAEFEAYMQYLRSQADISYKNNQ